MNEFLSPIYIQQISQLGDLTIGLCLFWGFVAASRYQSSTSWLLLSLSVVFITDAAANWSKVPGIGFINCVAQLSTALVSPFLLYDTIRGLTTRFFEDRLKLVDQQHRELLLRVEKMSIEASDLQKSVLISLQDTVRQVEKIRQEVMTTIPPVR